MKRLSILLTLFVLTFSVKAQDMVIKFKNDDPAQDQVGSAGYIPTLANKGIKSNSQVYISDHTIDGRRTLKSGYWIEFIGNTKRGIVLKNFTCTKEQPCKFTFRDVVNTRSDKSVTIKVGDYMQNFVLDGTGTTRLLAYPGGTADQVIYLDGKFLLNPTVKGFYIDGGRPLNMTTTAGGAAIQIKGWNSSDCNASNWNIGNVVIKDCQVYNANDEVIYANHNTTVGNYTRGKKLTVENVIGVKAGRDGGQAIAFDSVIFRNCTFDSLGLEKESNHISGFSLNAGNKYTLVENCKITNTAQLAYSGTEGVEGTAIFKNNYFDQGSAMFFSPVDGKLTSGNQAAYLKADKNPKFTYILSGNTIIAPKVLKAAVAVDNSTLIWDVSNTFTAPTRFRTANSTAVIAEVPYIQTKSAELTVEMEKTSTYEKVFVIYNGQKIQIK